MKAIYIVPTKGKTNLYGVKVKLSNFMYWVAGLAGSTPKLD